MSYGNYYEGPPQRRTSRALVRLVVFVWLLVFSCVGLRAFAIPAVNDFFYRRVAQAINPNVVVDVDPLQAVQDGIEDATLPSLPPLADEAITINDALATEYVRSQASALGLNDATVQFVPGGVVATITVPAPLVGEVSGTIRADARAEDGRIVLANEQIDGPIGSIISPTTLVDALENRLNQQIEQQGQRVARVDVVQGQATIVFE